MRSWWRSTRSSTDWRPRILASCRVCGTAQQRPGAGDPASGMGVGVVHERARGQVGQGDPVNGQGPAQVPERALASVGADRVPLQPGAELLQERITAEGQELLGVLRRVGRPQGLLGWLDQPHGEGDPGSPGEPAAPLGVAVGQVGDGPAGLVQTGRLPSLLPGLPRPGGQQVQQASHAVLVIGPGVAADVGELLGDQCDDLVDRGGRQLPERTWRSVRDRRRFRTDLGELPVRQRGGGLGGMAADPVRGQVRAHARPDGAIGHRRPPQCRRRRTSLTTGPAQSAAGNARQADRAGRPGALPCRGRWC